ncbi:MAG: hypothetical protein CMJ76_17070 [Planctomycetaceae bacterium]|nr:hypothetical protein [Planctomycetaceae bacterium]
MNNIIQTCIFTALAVGSVVAAVLTSDIGETDSQQNRRSIAKQDEGKPVFEGFTAQRAVELKITTYDDPTARIKSFSVKRDATGQWVIPSHNNYPADAAEQMASAAAAFSTLEVKEVIDVDSSAHEDYHVVEPNTETLDVGTDGVGTLITVTDEEGISYSLIIGAKVIKGVDAGIDPRMQQSYYAARRPESDIVFTVDLNMNIFETDFPKWIDTNLLGLNGLDIRQLAIQDYIIGLNPEGSPIMLRRSNSSLVLDEVDLIWKLDNMVQYDQNTQEPFTIELTENEEIDLDRINILQSALENLTIEGVMRKPAVLRPDLKITPQAIADEKTSETLTRLGLFGDPNTTIDNMMDLKSANGEIHISLQTGIKYILRFGEVDSTSGATDSVQRYLFVTTAFQPNMIPVPEYTSLPNMSSASPGPEDGCQNQEPVTQAEPTKETEQPELTPEQLAELKETIERDNARLKQEYELKLAEAQNSVRLLNSRFADWFYLISEKTFNKIHLANNDLIKAKSSELGDNLPGLPSLPGLPDVPSLPESPEKSPEPMPAPPAPIDE